METSFTSSWGAQNLKIYPCTADTAELRDPAVPENSSYQRAFDFGRSILVCPKCNNQNTFVRNGNTKAGTAIKCNNSSCRNRIADKSFFSFVKPLLTAASVLAESNKYAGPRTTAVAIHSLPQTPNQHITIIQVPEQQWDALMKGCTTLEDQVARLSEQLASTNSQVRPSSRQNPPSNRQATLPARKGGAQPRALPTNEVDTGLAPEVARGPTIPAPTPSASRSWADIARGRTRPSLNELPEAYK